MHISFAGHPPQITRIATLGVSGDSKGTYIITLLRVIFFFADDKRKAVLIRGLETPFFCVYAV